MKIVTTLLIFPIRIYKLFLSPLKIVLFGPYCRCRFSPTCSQFAIRVIKKYSFFKALYFIILRLARCHPFYGKHR
ncbi:MAG: membrane protein insertion efficiency factor YidD [Puniceicoccales bacterium]|nr:membrane protein insertion efficiency factor YidD [Puniceicoccales bacterium]